jgi:hypothetical protein
MDSSHEKNDYKRLKAELRRLKRPSAPWYLEGELHRRLHAPRMRFRYVGVAPTLIILTTLGTLAIAVYVMLVNPLILSREGMAPRTDSTAVVPNASAAVKSTPPPRTVTSGGVSSSAPSPRGEKAHFPAVSAENADILDSVARRVPVGTAKRQALADTMSSRPLTVDSTGLRTIAPVSIDSSGVR